MYEIDVALTDFGLTLEAALFAALIARDTAIPKSPRGWLLAFWFSTAAAALFGGILHGFLPDEAALVHQVVWRLSLLSIGLTALSGWMLVARGFLPRPGSRVGSFRPPLCSSSPMRSWSSSSAINSGSRSWTIYRPCCASSPCSRTEPLPRPRAPRLSARSASR